MRFAISTGLRRGDVIRVKWKDVDFSARRISFFERKKDRVAEVYVSPALVQDLKRLRGLKLSSYYVFPGRSEPKYGDGHLSSRAAYDVLQRNLLRAGLEGRPFHSLRATCVKLCQRRGWSESQTAKHVGDTVRVIQEHYATPSAGEMAEASSVKSLL
ncbi:site-specific integrase [Candidatus Woesearchaeota archaeon]|nr:site-specific integrase [Candidatus Woesearchaeota archaeon]